MDEHEIRERPKFEPRVLIPPGMSAFESTVAKQLDVLHQSTDALWISHIRAHNIAVQVEAKLKPMLIKFAAFTMLCALIPVIVAVYVALKK